MKTSDLEQQLLAHLELDAKLSVPELAKLLGRTQRVVSYTLAKLTDRGVLSIRPFVDAYRLGYRYFYIRAKPSQKVLQLINSKDSLRQFIQIDSVAVAYLCGGAFPLRCLVVVRGLDELDSCIASIEQFTDGVECELSYVRYWSFFGHLERLISERRSTKSRYTLQPCRDTVTLDPVDHQVLLELSTLGNYSLGELSRKLGLPQSTVRYRVKQLEDRKVILGYAYQSPAEGLLPIQYSILQLSVESWTKDCEAILYDLCNQESSIGYLARYFGGMSYDLGIGSRKTDDPMRIVHKISSTFGKKVSSITQSSVYCKPKLTNYPFGTYRAD